MLYAAFFGINNSHRDKHGALLDSVLLAEVYQNLTTDRQPDLLFAEKHNTGRTPFCFAFIRPKILKILPVKKAHRPRVIIRCLRIKNVKIMSLAKLV